MLRRLLLGTSAALTLATAACKDDGPTEPVYSDPVTAVYASSLNVDLAAMTKTSTGLYYRDVTVGTGATATQSSNVTVDYTGWVPTGRQFDSGKSVPFPLSGVIAGFREGIAGMKVGGSRKLVIPPALGYGSAPPAGSGIPANSVLVFDVKLVSIP